MKAWQSIKIKIGFQVSAVSKGKLINFCFFLSALSFHLFAKFGKCFPLLSNYTKKHIVVFRETAGTCAW